MREITLEEMFSGPAERFNRGSGKYEPYTLPKGAVMYCENMVQTVACRSCGKPLVYGESYTSLEINNKYGIGFAVCDKCFRQEVERLKNGLKRSGEE